MGTLPLGFLGKLAETIPSIRSELRLMGWMALIMVAVIAVILFSPLPETPKVIAVFLLVPALLFYVGWVGYRISRRPYWASEEAIEGMVSARYRFESEGGAFPPHVIEGTLSQAPPQSLPQPEVGESNSKESQAK